MQDVREARGASQMISLSNATSSGPNENSSPKQDAREARGAVLSSTLPLVGRTQQSLSILCRAVLWDKQQTRASFPDTSTSVTSLGEFIVESREIGPCLSLGCSPLTVPLSIQDLVDKVFRVTQVVNGGLAL